MRFSSQGLSLWFGTGDAPAPQGETPPNQSLPITIAVRPIHPSNRVDIRYRINGGLQRLLRASLAETNRITGVQVFRADFPPLPPEVTVEYAPILTSIGRSIDSLVDGVYPASFAVSPSAGTAGATIATPALISPALSNARFPFHLELICTATCRLRTELLGETPDGLRYDFFVEEGTLDGPLLRGKFLQGGDWMRVRRDGMGVPNIRVTFLLHDGAKILMEAGGWFDFGPEGYENARRGKFASSGNLMTQPSFFTADPRYAWLMRAQCFGVGVVDLSTFTLRDDIYRIVRPEAPGVS